MDTNNIFDFQHQIKENSEDLQQYLLELECWEKEMKKKEEDLKLIQVIPDEEIPPIRNTLYRPKKKNRHKKQKDKSPASTKSRIAGNDYQAWENFDANAELKKIDEETKQSSASENSEEEDEFCKQKRKQLAILHKDKGNEFFKKGNYDSAINSYTTGMQLDPENPLLPANRAMAFLKKEQFQSAENDCTLCLSIDPTYVKAYLRRGTARKSLNKIPLAKADFSKVLQLEPDNKQAQSEMKNLAKIAISESDSSISESEVVKAQELWPKFLGNKTVNTTNEFKNSKAQIEVMDTDKATIMSIAKQGIDELNVTSQNIIVREPSLPCVPTSSYQFLADWNEIESFPNLRYQYLKQFPPEKFPVIFKHYMEPGIFPKLIETLSTSFIEQGDDVFDYLKYLTDIGRFCTMIMFLSDEEEKALKNLLEHVKASNRPESEILDVLKKYGS